MCNSKKDPSDDSALLLASRSGQPDAFERLFTCHRAYLRKAIGMRLDPRLRKRLDTSDILQETQMEAIRRLPKYLERRTVPVRIWLRQIAQEKLRDARRRHLGAARRQATREVALPDGSAFQLARLVATSTPSEKAIQREVARLVREAIGQLEENDREILLMRNVEGLDYEAIGYLLEIEPAAARKRHGRALIRLGNLLGKMGLKES